MPEQYPFGFSEFNNELRNGDNGDDELTEQDFDEIKTNPPKIPSFPTFVFIVALIKDLLDIASFGFLGPATNFFCWMAIKTWLDSKAEFIKKKQYKKYFFTFVLEWFPWISALPQNTIFVLRAHAAEKKQVNKITSTLLSLTLKSQKR